MSWDEDAIARPHAFEPGGHVFVYQRFSLPNISCVHCNYRPETIIASLHAELGTEASLYESLVEHHEAEVASLKARQNEPKAPPRPRDSTGLMIWAFLCGVAVGSFLTQLWYVVW